MAEARPVSAAPGDASCESLTGLPSLDALARERLGRLMQEMYEPVLDEPLDPRLAELMQELQQARDQQS
ncbi:hypothetical protein F6X53_29570 [Methylobacterium soli]|uniref:Anti-sigma factor NepR domain-containing protein n=1 Tax=Methylobacterium soli TaxID=553447 RepID=A0A6L3ST32_9HYPH|nr:hypothetical protein F6X53_29570 [Methylobacterium soli]GJE43013.1 hypothetical protein AEGHOMDF_2190 [Methylobacterium soli]